MRKLPMVLFTLVILIQACSNSAFPDKSLMVSDNGKYLTCSNGTPFLWIGDTAWELFHKLNREDAVTYLENRAEKGVTVIQAIILAELDGLRVPNAYGDLPLIDMNPEKPNEAYFQHVDFIVDKANEMGLLIALAPTWGDKIYSDNPGSGPVVFNKDNAFAYGEFLGRRYKDKSIVWLLGGDRNIASTEVLDIWRAMAMGLKKGDEGRNLITYHPRGASHSAHWLHNEEWLDFNMYQSSHVKHFTEVYSYAEYASLLYPAKPFVDGEPPYEDIPLKFWEYYQGITKASSDDDKVSVLDRDGVIQNRSHFRDGFFTDSDIRVHGYWNFLSGACGYTYGNNAIWQMFEKGGNYAIPCLTDWREALDRPGSDDLRHIRKLFEARPFNLLIPDQSVIYGPKGNGQNHIRAAIASDNSFMLVYLSVGQNVLVNMNKLENRINASWYDTREGTIKWIGDFENSGIVEFMPPSSGPGNDWMLILDDSRAVNSDF